VERLALAAAQPLPQPGGVVAVLTLTMDEITAICRHRGALPLAISRTTPACWTPTTPPSRCGVRLVPVCDEYLRAPGEAEDPLAEDADSRCPAWCTATRTGCCSCHRLLLDQLPLLHPLAMIGTEHRHND